MVSAEQCPNCGSRQIASRWDAPRARMIYVCKNCHQVTVPTRIPTEVGLTCSECGWKSGHSPTCSKKYAR